MNDYVACIFLGGKLALRGIIALMLVSVLLFPLLPARAQGGVGLKQNTVVSGETITLGDVFHGLSGNESDVLGSSPRPGQDMVLNSRTLLRIALAKNVAWRPATTNDRVVISRAATIIDRDMISKALAEQLATQDTSRRYRIILPAEQAGITLPADQPAQFDIRELQIRDGQNRFQATLDAPSSANPLQSIVINGTLEPLVQVPVLKNTIRNGMIIGMSDIEMIDVKETSFKEDIVFTPEELIGMTARRMIAAGRPVKTVDVESPKMVERGDLVTMTFKSGPMILTTKGKALQTGAKGEVIRVVNTGSSKTIEARITADKEVLVETF